MLGSLFSNRGNFPFFHFPKWKKEHFNLSILQGFLHSKLNLQLNSVKFSSFQTFYLGPKVHHVYYLLKFSSCLLFESKEYSVFGNK